jgi:hypothetical protein
MYKEEIKWKNILNQATTGNNDKMHVTATGRGGNVRGDNSRRIFRQCSKQQARPVRARHAVGAGSRRYIIPASECRPRVTRTNVHNHS